MKIEGNYYITMNGNGGEVVEHGSYEEAVEAAKKWTQNDLKIRFVYMPIMSVVASVSIATHVLALGTPMSTPK